MERIVTNIININNLNFDDELSEYRWMVRFEGKNTLDVHRWFAEHWQEYEWLYEHSNYDLITWEIENNCFNWKDNSHVVAKCCPDKLYHNRYNWKDYSWVVARYCPNEFNSKRYNWKDHSWAVAEYCPDKLDPDKFNWKKDSWAIVQFCPDKLDPDKFNWKKHSNYLAEYCQDKLELRPNNM